MRHRSDLAERRRLGRDVDDLGGRLGCGAAPCDENPPRAVEHRGAGPATAVQGAGEVAPDARTGGGQPSRGGLRAGNDDVSLRSEKRHRIERQRERRPGEIVPGATRRLEDLRQGIRNGDFVGAREDQSAAVGQGQNGGVPASGVHRRCRGPVRARRLVGCGVRLSELETEVATGGEQGAVFEEGVPRAEEIVTLDRLRVEREQAALRIPGSRVAILFGRVVAVPEEDPAVGKEMRVNRQDRERDHRSPFAGRGLGHTGCGGLCRADTDRTDARSNQSDGEQRPVEHPARISERPQSGA